jgi:hypothetical protein
MGSAIGRPPVHGMWNIPEYTVWQQVKDRCLNPNSQKYRRYAGRGIQICERWSVSFVHFYEDMGPRPSPKHSLDRIDNDGDYHKDNCRWTTSIVQTNNRSDNVFLVFNGRRQTLANWSRELGFKPGLIRLRLNRGKWTVREALTTPTGRYSHKSVQSEPLL